MMGVPLAVVWLCSEVLYFELPTAALLFVALAAGLLCSTVATQIWDRRSRIDEVSFSELMIWSWYRVHKAQRRLERGLREAASADSYERHLQVLYELSGALESKDPYTRGHSRRVERYSFLIGAELGLSPEELLTLRMSAALHDVGKIHIPNSILHKPGRLSDEERASVQEHPVLGAEMVAAIGDEKIVETVRHHHERWTGGGYPDGIAGTDIPLFSRVIAVADSYDAIRSNRSYRPGAGRDETVSVIQNESGHQYDPDVVEAFMATLPSRSRVVAGVMSLTGPGALWRFVWQLFQRFGSAGLAPALGALGAAFVIVSSTLFSPVVPAVAAPVKASPQSGDSRDIVAGDGDSQRDRVLAERRTERREAARRASARRERRDRRAAKSAGSGSAATSGSGETAGSGSDTGGTTSGTGSGGSQPGTVAAGTGSGIESGTTSPATGSVSGTPNSDLSSVDDPSAEGRDCAPGTGKSSKGSRLHCR